MATMFKFNTVIVCIVNVVFTLVGITLNSVVVINLWNTQLRKKLCYFMILACFDLVVVVVFHPLIIFKVIFYCISMNFEKLVWQKYIYLFVFSLTGLLTMILERYLALVHPFFHEKFVTKSRLLTAFVLFQIPCGVVHILWMNIQHLSLLIYYAPFGIFSILICILNFKLFYIAKTLRKLALVNLGNYLRGSDSEPLRTVNRWKFPLTLASLGKISTCSLAVVCLFLCHIPTLVNIALKIAKEAGQRDQSAVVVEVWAETFLTINSTLNCSIFFYKNSVLRRHGAKYLVKCCCRRWQSQE